MTLINSAGGSATDAEATALLEVVESYFRLSDAGSPETLDLFAENIQIYFPVFGIRTGKAAFGNFVEGFLAKVAAIAHQLDDFRCVVAGHTVVVEGTTRGRDNDGREWEGGRTPGGRFCSVFEIHNGLILRMHIYLDPDYTGLADHGFGWDDQPDGGW